MSLHRNKHRRDMPKGDDDDEQNALENGPSAERGTGTPDSDSRATAHLFLRKNAPASKTTETQTPTQMLSVDEAFPILRTPRRRLTPEQMAELKNNPEALRQRYEEIMSGGSPITPSSEARSGPSNSEGTN